MSKKKKKKSFTKEQLRRFMEGESAYEAMGGTRSPNAGKQQFMSQEVEKLLRKNPEIFEDMDKEKYRRGGKVAPKTPKIPNDPDMPTSMGGTKTFQMPYKRNMSKKLGTKKLPVGKPPPNRMLPPMFSTRKNGKGTLENFEGSFRSGGEVRAADVRDNPKRGKCY